MVNYRGAGGVGSKGYQRLGVRRRLAAERLALVPSEIARHAFFRHAFAWERDAVYRSRLDVNARIELVAQVETDAQAERELARQSLG